MVNGSCFVGSGSLYPSNNVIVVTGNGSRWENQSGLYLGWGSSSNSIVISSNALLTAPLLTVGMFDYVSNNVLTVTGVLCWRKLRSAAVEPTSWSIMYPGNPGVLVAK